MPIRSSYIATAAILALSHGAPAEVLKERKPHYDNREAMEDYRERLHAAYLRCSLAAEARFLSKDEVDSCGFAFLKLKISFLNGVTVDRYETMKPSLRATANRKGYDAYRAWRHRQIAGTVTTK